MSEDASLPAGAVAPRVERTIRSTVLLDALWVVVPALLLIGSSFLTLVDLRTGSLRTGDAPLRVYAVGLPALAIVGAFAAGVSGSRWTGSRWLISVATGMLAPAVAAVGAFNVSLFLDDAAAYAEAGVALSLATASLGVVALVRWFVYHPVALQSDESRPTASMSQLVAAAGAVAAVVVVVTAVGDGGATALGFVLDEPGAETETALQFVAQIVFALFVPFVVVAAAAIRSQLAYTLALSASAAQVAAVVAARADLDRVELGELATLWTNVIALASLLVVAVLCVAGLRVHEVDEIEPVDDDDEPWRWSPDT